MKKNQTDQLVCNDAMYIELEESIRRLSDAKEKEFEEIKREKWFVRLWDIVTFSKKGEKRLAEQIGSLAQAQQIVAQYLLKTSLQSKNISDLVNNNATYIEKLAGQSICFKKELTSLSNLVLLLNEINNGQYNGIKPITAMCLILSQLDNEVLANRRALNSILLSLNNHNVLNGKNVDIIDFLLDVADMSQNEVAVVYTELSSIRMDRYANLILELIETLYFSYIEGQDKDETVLDIAIAQNIEKKYDSTTLDAIFISFINSVIAYRESEGDFAITNPTAKQEREEAEKLFYEGKLIAAYSKFVHAADDGDARACYFLASYYFEGYGTTEKNEELYEKYVDLGIKRRDPFCCLENAVKLYRQGEKKKADYWKSKSLKQVGLIADKGDSIACHLIAQMAYLDLMDMFSTQAEKNSTDCTEEDRRKMSVFEGIYRKYSSKAIEAGYWGAAFSKCFSIQACFDGDDQKKSIEKYGWMLESIEWVSIHKMYGSSYLAVEKTDYKYYKNAAACFLKAYKLKKEKSTSGFISFFLNAGVIDESEVDGIMNKSVKILYYKGLDCKEPALLQELGDLYYFGVGDKQLGMNKTAAFEYYEKAYEEYDYVIDSPETKMFDHGKATTAYMLGHMTLYGIGTESDAAKAVAYYQDAVRRGEKRAVKPLADCYLNGVGVSKDVNRYNELIAGIDK